MFHSVSKAFIFDIRILTFYIRHFKSITLSLVFFFNKNANTMPISPKQAK